MKPWTKLSEQEFRVNRFRTYPRAKYRLPNGHIGTFYLRQWHGPVVCAFVLTSDRRVVLMRQFRCGQQRILDELPGGSGDPGETPRQAIVREVLEKSGYGGRVKLIAKSTNDSWTRGARYHFVITAACRVAQSAPDSNKCIETVTKTIAQFRR